MIPGIVVNDLAALKEWLEATGLGGHDWNCHSRSEGQSCCLDDLVDQIEAIESDE